MRHRAGFALATSPNALHKNPETDRIPEAIREWETARRGGVFTAAQREALRNPKRELHLERMAEGGWDLFPFHDSARFTHEPVARQPGEPSSAQWEVVTQGHRELQDHGPAIARAVIHACIPPSPRLILLFLEMLFHQDQSVGSAAGCQTRESA